MFHSPRVARVPSTKPRRTLLACVALLAVCTTSSAQISAPGSEAARQDPHAQWTSTGRTADEQRYSPLDQINDGNVGQLSLAWYADFDLSRGEEATPLVIDGILYVSTAWSMVKAFDAVTGRALWSYDPEVPRRTLVRACCDAVNRGVAAWNGRIFVATLDGRLVSLNAKTGKPLWSVQTTPLDQAYTVTGAPRIVKGNVIIGNGGAELGVRGYVTAYDAATGRKKWRFYTVPGDPRHLDGEVSDPQIEVARSTWAGDKWWRQKAGGGTAWDAFAYDAELDLLYIGTGNGSPWSRMARSDGQGDNLYLSSILAVRPSTGKYVWHYQTTPGDEWDYTATQHIILADLDIGGEKRKVLLQAPKNGFFYVLDRASGELISAEKYVPANWASKIDIATGRPVENPEARYSERGKSFFATPSSLGGHNWPPMAFSPRTGFVYIPAQELAAPFTADPSFKKSALGYNTATLMGIGDPAAKAPIEKAQGYLLAWDPVRQKAAWRAARETFGNGGVLATAGNLVFQGTGTGHFKAMRATDGRELWSIWAQAGVLAAPMSYMIDGRQYIAVLAGCGGVYGSACRMVGQDGRRPNLDRLLVFALGGTAELPPAPASQPMVLDPPPLKGTPGSIALGRRKYAQYCAVCHGFGAVSLGNQPDLRYSPLLNDEAWFTVVLNGALSDSGMVGFGTVLDRAGAENIRQYLIDEAHDRLRMKKPDDKASSAAHSS